jgi:hypothetical protein
MQTGRRTILGSLAACLAAPFVFGRETVLRALAPRPAAPPPAPKINPPVHSVKRRD